ncbi:HK97 family phage prohead protease [Clostridium sp.]|uniref:HK97 family phage prohead protease n=1 Tax=Clostridium sp. TaxID=1506 RepID=UPI00290442E9|nr:HK97 family phage prohead protease [Clostridium sp.]MDU1031925.1 HK97 family phage prohead protease [Clostridium sp.]
MRIEVRNDSVLLDGYVNATGKDSKPIPSPRGKFIEQIKPEAFQKSLEKRKNVDLLLNHDKKRKLGSTSEGNLELFEDGIGLRGICTVEDPETVQKAREGKLRGWSFGFYPEKDSWIDQDGTQKRFIEELDLFEVSIIDDTRTPAYVGTSIEMRDNKEILVEERTLDVEVRVVTDNSNNYEKYEKMIEKFKEAKKC